MKLYILGTTKDDKGTQLEQLTTKILEHQGYKNIVTNVQVSGASELDVTASKSEITGVKEITTPVVCECKAHEKPITMLDWLKFIGKIYIERKKNPQTIGLMLALTGANGAVMGSASTDFSDDPKIQLIANDDLIQLLSQIYRLPDATAVKDRMASLPIPPVSSVDIVYYHSTIWWIASFAEGRFTLCHADTKPASVNEVADVLNMLPSTSIYQTNDFVDVWNSVETSMQLRQIEKLILIQTIKSGVLPINVVVASIKNVITGDIVDEALVLKALQGCQFINIDNKERSISLKTKEEFNMADFYRSLLSDVCPVEVIKTSFYQDNIDSDLLDQIWQIQGGYKVKDDKIENCLKILKYSPSALMYALHPDQFLLGAVKLTADEGMTELYHNHFWKSIQMAFIEDYQNTALGDLFLDENKISKIEVMSSLKIIISGGEDIDISVAQNFALAKLQGTNQTVLINTKTGA